MRIDRLDLTAHGPFTGVSLDLSAGEAGLHLIYGPNEAGKSSALRAIHDFFRGFEVHSPDDFVHQYKDLKVGAVLRDGAGRSYELVRRKGNKNTLIGADGVAVGDPEAWLTRALGGLAPADYLRKYVIGHDELIAGGREAAAGGGDLGALLFASSGLGNLGAVRETLRHEAEGLYKPRGKLPTINAKLDELSALDGRLKGSSLKGGEWLRRDETLRAARARKAALEAEFAGATAGRNRLRRLAEAVAPVARLRAVSEELTVLADAPRLAADFTDQRREAVAQLGPSLRAEAEALARLDALRADLDAAPALDPVIDQAEAVAAIHLRLGRRQQSAQDQARLIAERTRLRDQARATLRDLGLGLGLGSNLPDDDRADDDPLDVLRPTAPARAAVLGLIRDRETLRRADETAAADRQTLDARRAASAADLDALGPERDPSDLNRALKGFAADGDLDARAREAREALGRDARRADDGLADLGRWSGPAETLGAAPVPAAEAAERFDDELEEARAGDADDARRLDEAEAEALAAEARLQAVRLAGEVPDEAALVGARSDRDADWQRLRLARTWDDAGAAGFERAVRRADDLADRLRREADRVADHARALADRARTAAARDDRRARRGEARDRLADWQARWAALWAAAGVAAPGEPREMLAWLRRRADLVALNRANRDRAADLDGLEALADGHRRALTAAVGVAAPAGLPLADLAELGRAEVVALARQSQARERHRADLTAIDRDRPAAEARAEAARVEWDRWQDRWAAAVAPLRLGPDALPAQAEAVLGARAALFESLDKARAHRRELDALEAEAELFARDARDLAERVAPDLLDDDPAADPRALAAGLYDRLARALADRQRRDDLADRCRERQAEADRHRAEAEHQRGRLAALRREARCDSDDDLPGVEARSARRQTLEVERDALQTRLAVLAGGAPPDAFADEAGRADPDALASQSEALDQAVADLERERQSLDQTIGSETALLNQMDGGSLAADAGQEAEDLRAKVRADVEQYARLRLASAVLREGIERHRKTSQGPLLGVASPLFARLTLGAFEGLRVDYDDRDEPVLKGVRPGGRDALGVGALSLGTADQLYLALRLAALRLAIDAQDPLPLIVDDVLIQFDDARASATLAALADFARRTQVLVFTHHAHLIALAEAAVPAGLLFHQTLPARAGEP